MKRFELLGLSQAKLRLGYAAALGILLLFLAATATIMANPPGTTETIIGGPFWHLPLPLWLLIGLLAAGALLLGQIQLQALAIGTFGLAVMGTLGYLEPLGVFHDSWQNVGLGELSLTPEFSQLTHEVPYVSSAPGAFLLLGLLRSLFPSTDSFLRIYPLLCVFFYSAGIYTLALAFAETHKGKLSHERVRFALLSVFAFLALAPLFYVRINPSPQSLAFALMPFCLAALMYGTSSLRFRLLALASFGALIMTHPITSVMTLAFGGSWLLIDQWVKRRSQEQPLIANNTIVLYVCLFLTWMAYVGVWIVQSGEAFAQRILSVLHSGQHATVSPVVTDNLALFVWLHRVGMVAAALLIVAGLWALFATTRLGLARLLAWLLVTAVWLPFFILGEFADRGPLFASIPTALVVGAALNARARRPLRWLVVGLALVMAVTTTMTAYPNHIGEIIAAPEISAFEIIAARQSDSRIAYSYIPPLKGEDLPIYASNRIRAFSVHAADFSFERLTKAGDIIVFSRQMFAIARLQGPQPLAKLEAVEDQLLDQPGYDLIFDNGYVRAFRAR